MQGISTDTFREAKGYELRPRDGTFLNRELFDELFTRKGITGYAQRAKALGLGGPSSVWRVSRPDYPDPCGAHIIRAIRRYFPRVSYSRLFTDHEGVLCRVYPASDAKVRRAA